MSAARELPARPSLESLRKQAKKLARDNSLSLREAQLALAREYGFAGWKDLIAEVSKRLGKGLEWAVLQARRLIHDNDIERLKQLLAEYPALLAWHGADEEGSLVGMATGAYGDAGDPERERWFTRAACAEFLIDAGAIVTPAVPEGILRSRARGLLHLFHRKGLLPDTLKFHAALGDIDAVRAILEVDSDDYSERDDYGRVVEAFVRACGFAHEAVALLLLDRLITMEPKLGVRVDATVGRAAFVRFAIERGLPEAMAVDPWRAYVMQRINRALHERDLAGFVHLWKGEPWLLTHHYLDFQNGIITTAAYVTFEKPDGPDRLEFIRALLDLEPDIVRRQPPPRSQAIEHSIVYGHTHLLPLLTRIWRLPDDLPHAAGTGNLARVKQWFDADGAAALGDPMQHMPHTSPHQEVWDDWGISPQQKVLDTALAWSVINHHFDVADFLLEHGADINTRWNSHEPASILHTLVFEDDYEAMQYLIDRGIDMTIEDYRWGSNAAGWARYGKSDEKMALWLEEAERKRKATADPSLRSG